MKLFWVNYNLLIWVDISHNVDKDDETWGKDDGTYCIVNVGENDCIYGIVDVDEDDETLGVTEFVKQSLPVHPLTHVQLLGAEHSMLVPQEELQIAI